MTSTLHAPPTTSTARPRALLVENIHPRGRAVLEEAGFDVEERGGAVGEDDLIAALTGVDYLGIRSTTFVTRRVLEASPALKAIGAFCIGVNQVDLDAAAEAGVAVFNAPYSNTRSVVEMAIAEIIAMTRQLFDRSRDMHEGRWNKSAVGAHEIRGRTLGIVGYGSIGTQLSVVAEALGMSVAFYDTADKLAIGNAHRCDTLPELLGRSDVVSLHVDGRASNTGLFGEPELAQMRPGAIFLNLSRGLLVDHDALRRHLATGHLAGAAVDVFTDEPRAREAPFDHPLRGVANVILTPHIAGSTQEAQEDIGGFVATKLATYAVRGSTQLSVNLPVVTAPELTSGARISHLHLNRPGVLAEINSILGGAGLNVTAQTLSTRSMDGLVVTDVDGDIGAEVQEALEHVHGTRRVRVLVPGRHS